MSKTAEDNLRKINIERKKAGLRTFPITQERILKERKIMSKTKSKVSAMQASRDSLKSIEGMTKADKRSKKWLNQNVKGAGKTGKKQLEGGRTISDQDISKIVSRLYAAISGRTSSKFIGKEALGNAKGGKIKKRASGGRVKKSK